MHQLKYRIANLSPIILSARHGDSNMVGSLQYIPGTSVLGMLATRYLNQKKIATQNAILNKEFHNLFIKGEIIFNNSYIIFKDKDGDEHIHFPAPVSLHQEKRGDRIYDLLWLEAENNIEIQTKAIKGFCNLDENSVRFMDVETSLNFHHARDRITGTSEEGKIFNYESIAKGQIFQGVVKGDSEALNNLVSACGDRWIAHLGRSKNAQYGKISFEFIDKIPQPVSEKIQSGKTLSLTLLSDTILYNENGFSTTDPKELEKYLGLKIKKSFIRKDNAETFVNVWQLKKPSETCFKAGSCFLLEAEDDDKRIRLIQFQKTGFGERTHEGFGQCIIGWQTEDKLTKYDSEKPELDLPTTQIPETALEILKTLIRNTVRNEVALNAMEDMKSFERLPTPSLISRLIAMADKLERDKFLEALTKFRRSATEKIANCRNKKQNLKNFLIAKNISIQNVLHKPKFHNMRTLCEVIGYIPEDDKEFEKELYRTYLGNFFSTMRKAKTRMMEDTHDKY